MYKRHTLTDVQMTVDCVLLIYLRKRSQSFLLSVLMSLLLRQGEMILEL